MKYNDFDAYSFAWVFRRADMALSDTDRDSIHPLASGYAKQVWQREVSKDAVELDALDDTDWPMQETCWTGEADWEAAFDSEDTELPEELSNHLGWQNETLVFICYDSGHVLETRYATFRKGWKAFLFAGEQAMITGRKRKEALWFVDESRVRLGQKPA